MTTLTSTSAHVVLPALLVCILIAGANVSSAQTPSAEASPVKSDEYGDLHTEDAAVRLALLAEALFRQPKLRWDMVGSGGRRVGHRGSSLRRISGLGSYLTEAGGIGRSRVLLGVGGYTAHFPLALWLVPEGGNRS